MNRATIVVLQRVFLAFFTITTAQWSWAQSPLTSAELEKRFKAEQRFWKQEKIAEDLIALHDPQVLSDLEPWLTSEDRHVRANAALVFAGMGDDRGFNILKAILNDFSGRPIAQGMPSVKGGVSAQIRGDRYYALHILGVLRNREAVPTLVPLLTDRSINQKVAWALGEIGDRTAIPALIAATSDATPDLRLVAIDALVKLNAKEALPRIRALLEDNQRIHSDGLVPVSQAVKEAVATLEVPSWPTVEEIPVATRIITEEESKAPPISVYYGECQVTYIADGRAFLIWAPAYAFFDEAVVRQKMSSCPVDRFLIRYNPNNPADAIAMRRIR